MHRPSILDKSIAELAVVYVLPKINLWLKTNSVSEKDIADQQNQILNDLNEAFIHRLDGYDVAKYLESKSWMVDENLVKILSGVKYSIYLKSVKNWVKNNKIVAKLPIGSQVEFKKRSSFSTEIGIISNINEELGEYVIKTDETMYIVPYENVVSDTKQ